MGLALAVGTSVVAVLVFAGVAAARTARLPGSVVATGRPGAEAKEHAFTRSGVHLGVVPSGPTANSPSSESKRSDAITYQGGHIERSPWVYAIFWDPVGDGFPPGYLNLIDRYLGDVDAAGFSPRNAYAVPTQYYQRKADGTREFAENNWTYGSYVKATDPAPSGGCANYTLAISGHQTQACLTDVQLINEIAAVQNYYRTPVGYKSLYLLFLPPDVGLCYQASGSHNHCYGRSDDPGGFCAYHSWATGRNVPPLIYAADPYAGLVGHGGCSYGTMPNGNFADTTINFASHEMIEAQTDPLGQGWRDSSYEEVADLCLIDFGDPLGNNGTDDFNQVINQNDYWLQEEWSNRTGSCVQRNDFPQPKASFSYRPKHPHKGDTLHFKARVSGPGASRFSYEWHFGGGETRGPSKDLKKVSHSFHKRGQVDVQLVVFDRHGDQDEKTRTVAIR